MPSTSYRRALAPAAHDPTFAKKVGVPKDVAKDFNKADTDTKLLSDAEKKKNRYGAKG